MLLFRTLPYWVTFTSTALSQFIPPPKDLTTTTGYYNQTVRYKQVPDGICELTPGIKSYSGYVDVEENQHIFWWFFETRRGPPKDAPLTVWINGGPGSSSMIGLFQELGPCRVDQNGEVVSNPYAWNNYSNMLFIDQPTMTGFSYSEPVPGYTSSGNIVTLPDTKCPDYAAGSCGTYSYPNVSNTAGTTQDAAPAMWKTLQGFMGAFPQYARHDFNFATESYGGHYGPVFNEYIEQQNELIQAHKLPGAQQIRLHTVLIGNGWFDPLIQYEAYYNFTVSPGNTYLSNVYNQSTQDEVYNFMYGRGNCYDMTVDCKARGIDVVCAQADNFCADLVESTYDNVLGRSEYDFRELAPDPFPYEYYVDYLNTPKVQQAIGAYVNFTESSSTVGTAFAATGDDDRESGTVEDVKQLLDQGVYVFLYSGDADYICNWLGLEVVSEHIEPANWTHAGYQNITTSDKIVHGQVKQSGRFAFARIYESGHEVPFYQPLAILETFKRAINGQDIATGKINVLKTTGYLSTGSAKSTYREGNGTVQFEVVPADATYNTTLNAPNPYGKPGAKRQSPVKQRRRRYNRAGYRPMR